MSQNTTVQTKKEFLNMLSRTIGNDDVVLWTQNTNVFELKKKLNEKRVTFGFAADAFDRKDGVGDLMREPLVFGAIVCKKEILSEGARELVIKKNTRKQKAH